jgi:cytidine deaminase
MDYTTLAKRALAARRYSHSPFSHFRVGAAILAKGGKIYTGCNIESSSFGLTMCAERTALFKAISEGRRAFKAIAVATGDTHVTPPCGACRQLLMDLAGDIDCVMVKRNGSFTVMKLSELLPHPFGSTHFSPRK